MENIHILPTNKPSKLASKDSNGKLEVSDKNTFFVNGFGFTPQNIYITSDEKIKEGDWFINVSINSNYINKRAPKASNRYAMDSNAIFFNPKKIILTTDDQLIKDGVQAIDDEFLEWFVKNPSCEELEVDLVPVNEFGSEIIVNGYGFDKFNYKIIIPKEEPKQGTMSEAIKEVIKNQLNQIEEPKQETLVKCLCGEKTICDCQLPKSTITKKVYEQHNHLQGFINQFEEGGEHQELSNEDWTVSRFLQWLELNNFKIIKNG